MRVVLGTQEHVVFILISATVISSTSVGAIAGGVITTKFLGSYTNKRSVFMCLAMLILLCAACGPMSFFSNVYAFSGCVWIVMFCHGFIEPIFTGILINSVKAEERPTASSVLIFMEMILGFLPAPYVYGLVVDSVPVMVEGQNVSPWGMRGINAYSIVGVLLLILSIMLRKPAPEGEDESGEPEPTGQSNMTDKRKYLLDGEPQPDAAISNVVEGKPERDQQPSYLTGETTSFEQF